MTSLASSAGPLIGIVFGVMLILSGLGLSLALNLPRARPQLDWIEFGFVAFMFSVGFALWLGLILAWVGLFSLGALILLLGVSTLVSWIIVRRRGVTRSWVHDLARPTRAEAALIGLLALLSVIYFRPHEFILGGADAGVYVNMGAQIARSGRLLIDDPLIAQLDPSLSPVFFREQPPTYLTQYYYLPGYYVSDSVPGQIIPQFYALQAVSIAILTAIGGVPLGLFATPLWGLLGIGAVYFLTRSLFDRRAALLAVLLLGVVILQNWFSRYPTAEVLTQAYLFAGLYALSRVLQGHIPARSWGFLAGLWLGLIFLARIDMILVMAVLPVVLMGLAAARRWSPGLTTFTITLGVLILQSVIHALVFAWPYTYNTYQGILGILLGRGWVVWLAAGLGFGLVLVVGTRWINRIEDERRTRLAYWLRVTLIAIVVGAALYAYFLRPIIEAAPTGNYWYGASQVTSTNRENLVRLGWYVTPLGLAIALVGVCLVIWRERSLAVQVFVAIGLLSTVVYVINILNNPHHIYAMRRYVPVIIPALMMWGAYGLAAVSQVRWRGASVIAAMLLLAWLGGMVWQSRVIWRQVDYAGTMEALTRLDRQFEPGATVLFDDQSPVGLGDVIGTPLRFIFDHPVLVLRDPQAVTPEALRTLVQGWQQQGRQVYVAREAAKEFSIKDVLLLSEAQQFTFDTTVLLPTYTDYPNQVVPLRYDLKVQKVQPLR
jgi:hypothetical protein